MLRFLQSIFMNEISRDTTYSKIDQMPPFNMTLIFTNEQGFASFRRLLGVVFVNNGTVYSIQDMFTERTMTYMALDYTELMPLTLSSPVSVGSAECNQGSRSCKQQNLLARTRPKPLPDPD
jgi:hypothetical protein